MSAGRRDIWVRAGALVALIGLGGAFAATTSVPDISAVRTWLDATGPAAWLLMIVGLGLALATPLPRSVLSVLVGAVAGFPLGLAIVVVGSALGGLVGYAASRCLGRAALVQVAGRRLGPMEELLRRRGFLAVVTARVMPMMPFMAVSFAAGLTGVRLAPYTAGTVVGLLPGSILYVAIGSSTALVDWSTPSVTSAFVVVVAVIVAGVTLAWRRRHRDAVRDPVHSDPTSRTARGTSGTGDAEPCTRSAISPDAGRPG
ncbi:TVP38/TMEM64 family protein [Blastococcus sp. TF02-8]|uniref:TVP38/TMEM64 family protein n=1 Tax=Blastococcus sp. TF02-8 TaxID=2250574 RepID=UPI000DE911DF|nr:TVP38/TMEM64 family protein [Blastococcus sp. TF02-8]RBY97542.1 TVP38/TMEM64 family protein [Blastococcus sp. TF02-8]